MCLGFILFTANRPASLQQVTEHTTSYHVAGGLACQFTMYQRCLFRCADTMNERYGLPTPELTVLIGPKPHRHDMTVWFEDAFGRPNVIQKSSN